VLVVLIVLAVLNVLTVLRVWEEGLADAEQPTTFSRQKPQSLSSLGRKSLAEAGLWLPATAMASWSAHERSRQACARSAQPKMAPNQEVDPQGTGSSWPRIHRKMGAYATAPHR